MEGVVEWLDLDEEAECLLVQDVAHSNLFRYLVLFCIGHRTELTLCRVVGLGQDGRVLACPRRCSQYLSLEFDIFLQSVFHLGQEQREYKRWDFDKNETFQKRHLTGGGMRFSRAELLESWNFETGANMQTLKSLPVSLLSYRIGFQ